jgi:non-heme chloroperoxidase
MRLARRFAVGIGISLIVLLCVAGAMVAFSHPNQPQALHSVTDPFAQMDLASMPSVARYKARDGAQLSYRLYPGKGNQVIVLVHGSAGSSSDMHLMAKALQNTGATAIVPDLRGHGANFPHGDVAYVDQLDDDMADLASSLKPGYKGQPWTLLGFSSIGGLALRIASEHQGDAFQRFVLLSPFLRYDAPTARPAAVQPGKDQSSHWYSVSIPRIVGLSILNNFGIHHLDGLPVLAFPVPTDIEATTASYSFGMYQNFDPHDDFRSDIRHVSKPMQVFVGSRDELFLPDEFSEVFSANRKDIPVTILPGMTHSDMVTRPMAIEAVVKAVQ